MEPKALHMISNCSITVPSPALNTLFPMDINSFLQPQCVHQIRPHVTIRSHTHYYNLVPMPYFNVLFVLVIFFSKRTQLTSQRMQLMSQIAFSSSVLSMCFHSLHLVWGTLPSVPAQFILCSLGRGVWQA